MTKRIALIGSTVATASWRDDELQAFERDFLSAGVIQGIGSTLAVVQHAAGANMSVDVAAGRALINITNTNLTPSKTYNVYFDSDAVTNLAIATADPTNPRIDIVCAKVDVSQNPDASAGNIASIIVVTGTPAGSPSAPATPANCLLLANVAVAASAASILTANITDKRVYVDASAAVLTKISRQGLGNNLATVGGTGDAITLTLSPVPTSYAAPMVIWFKATAANTTAVTVNVNGLGAIALKRLDGATALVANDIANGQEVCIAYDGTNFQMLSQRGQDTSVQKSQIGFYGDGNDGAPTWTSGATLNPASEFRYTTETLPVSQTLTVSSTNTPLIIHNTSDVTINGIVDLNGKGGAGGAGKTSGTNQVGNAGTSGSSLFSISPAGGGGGGFGSNSGSAGAGGGGASFVGNGGVGTSGTAAGGSAGSVLSSAGSYALLASFLRGVSCGAGGGSGGLSSTTSATAAGGIGGGALVWLIGGNLTLGASSIIRANGTAGGDGTGTATGSGGGAGGMILIIVAGTITNNGVALSANGGAGGTTGNLGGSGASGRIIIYSLSMGTTISV